MAIKGLFRKQLAVLSNGTQRNIYSLILYNDDFWGTKTFNIVIMDSRGTKSASFSVELKSGKGTELDVRNTGWDWCLGDRAILYDKNGREKQRWLFSPKIYGEGECPDCHGTHRCNSCGGKGQWPDKMRNMVCCPVCHGTGICQTCYVPIRDSNGVSPSQVQSQQSATPKKYHRPVTVLRGLIKQRERELDRVNRELNNRTNPQPTKILHNNWPFSGTTVYVKPEGDFSSYTYHLARLTATLESEIRDLYLELADAEKDNN